MNLNSKNSLIERLRRGPAARRQLVESHVTKGLAHQLRATRDKLGWSQDRLADEAKMNQNAISRLENADYGRPTLTTLKRLAVAMDVGLVVRFVPFSELVDWVSGTPHLVEGLTKASLAVSSFSREENEGIFARSWSAFGDGIGTTKTTPQPSLSQLGAMQSRQIQRGSEAQEQQAGYAGMLPGATAQVRSPAVQTSQGAK